MANPSLAPAGIPASSSSSSCSPLPPGDSPQVQVFEFLQTADLRGQLLNLVIKKVKHFQILQFCYVWWHSCGNRNAECECRNLAPGSECQRYILLSFQMRERWNSSAITLFTYIYLSYIISVGSFLGSSSPPASHGNVSSKGRRENLCHEQSLSKHYITFYTSFFFLIFSHQFYWDIINIQLYVSFRCKP